MFYLVQYREVRDFFFHKTFQVAPATQLAMREELEEQRIG